MIEASEPADEQYILVPPVYLRCRDLRRLERSFWPNVAEMLGGANHWLGRSDGLSRSNSQQ